MSTLGFDNYVEPLKLYLHKYRESTPTKRTPKREGSRGAGSPQTPPGSLQQIPYQPTTMYMNQYQMLGQVVPQLQYSTEGQMQSVNSADNSGIEDDGRS